MVLVSFIITLDDVLGNAGAYQSGGSTVTARAGGDSSLLPVTVVRNCNLNSGVYKATVEGMQIASGELNTTTFAYAPQLINISSPSFQFPGNAIQGMNFANNANFTHSDVGGRREFLVNVGQGNIFINMFIAQFGAGIAGAIVAPYTLSTTLTWTRSNFAYMILSLNLENCDNKALFGNAR
jgi:hypothetical protein